MRTPRSARVRPPFSGFLIAMGVLALAACAGAGANPARPGTLAARDTSLEGAFRWTTFDQQPAPVEFPPGTGVMLVGGTLEFRGAAA
ncbi:MAG TPA: hypothetical protein VFR37_02145, partial [Longimicrobium sp.]|nr:hypothetical protein [Longimicrobium sp.]